MNATPEDYLREEAIRDMKFEEWKRETRFQPSTGCWIDGRWGIYGATRLIEIAQDYGFPISDLDEKAVKAWSSHNVSFQDEETGEYYNTSDWIFMQGGLADEAEEWLNENVAVPGYFFGWHDGEFFYMHHSWWNDEEDYDNQRRDW